MKRINISVFTASILWDSPFNYELPEPEALLGVAGPEGAEHHGGDSHEEDQHQRQVEVPLFPTNQYEWCHVIFGMTAF